ncbi:MAG: RluA family pseudouridine synthase [Desulfocapsaceae bacterium]|nr:RluA family pseudouridine synthase [Desulfocapsaceae bacterium]
MLISPMGKNSSDYHEANLATDEFILRVDVTETGWRLDHFLVHHFPNLSRSQLTAAVKNCHILVNGCSAKASKRLTINDLVSGRVIERGELVAIPQPVDFELIYEDEFLLLVSKPPNLVVHPANGNPDNTLVNGLLFHCRQIAEVGDSLRPGIVHRLDKDTSGIMVVAKKADVHRKLMKAFKQREIKKRYQAIVVGRMAERSGRIVAPIGRHPVNRKKMAILPERGKFAATSWRLVQHLADRYSFISLDLETGRTHQIRVHLASIGHPVAGDLLYGSTKTDTLFPRQMLHAAELEFIHPITQSRIAGKAPLANDIVETLRKLGFHGELN